MRLFFGLVIAICLGTVTGAAQSDDETWPVFIRQDEPHFTGQFMIASDPVIINDDTQYRLFYRCLDPLESVRTVLCQALSTDGYTWTNIVVDDATEGLVLRGESGDWGENLEGSYVVYHQEQYGLFYSGYRDEGDPARDFPAALGLATSDDAIHFRRGQREPILQPTPGWYDNDAIYSPVIFRDDEGWTMIYVGHCYTRCDYGTNTSLLAATSADGVAWKKREEPVLLANPDISWMSEGVAEPGLVIEDDGTYTLFFTGLQGDGRVIGMARSQSPFGPWIINPEPILTSTADSFDGGGVLAPFVLIESQLARL